MKENEIYHTDPEILGGTPVFTGTRVPIDSLLAFLKGGESVDDFLTAFPSVARAQVEAFLDLLLRTAVPDMSSGKS